MSVNSSLSFRYKVIFRSLKYRNYKLFFYGQSISLIGTWMQRIAVPWLVYKMTDSVFLLGITAFAGQIPSIFLSPFAGVITDRLSRYKVLLWSQVFSMVHAFLLAGLVFSGIIMIWQIIFLSFIIGCINTFEIPARHSFVIEMVEKKEDLGNGIALNSLMFNGARLIGPSIAGILLASAGEGICFLINGFSFLFVIISLKMMRLGRRDQERKRTHIINELKEGFNYTFGFLPIRHIILLLGLVNMMVMFYSTLMPVFAKEILAGDSHTYGFLIGAAGFGALLGALFLASRETVLKLGRIVPAAVIVFGTGLIILSFSRIFILSLIVMVFVGMGLMLQAAASNTILQTITDDDKRGRVMSFYTMAIMGTAPFGSLLAGTLAKTIGTPYTIFIGGIVSITGALFFLRKLPGLKKIVRPIYIRMGIIPEVARGIQNASETGV
ncbi:MAG: MFS transporter [Bacteroidetes bacterium GWE2_41_25]|nr:MAG: MFS transporter [Bacteroidetes bacterium GWA2_40_15]OFX83768.1 MAG: MFS transporter [Bacteroidetes bacterium GWC2_40_22]OFY03078.1 MAG: MFS transporter [Bacteroidetes bacterium GWE2_41_25]OFY60057.1 MAG: MFS transporter [Bacteroidetes bacterium GWF2_41_9]HAM09212.1 MFS transporter [Bacteroidales bacterium]